MKPIQKENKPSAQESPEVKMDSQTKNLLQNGPGSVGETAREFAKAYARVSSWANQKPQETPHTIEEFNNSLISVLNFRALIFEKVGMAHTNLLFPIYEKGINEIYRIVNLAGSPAYQIDYKTDLPSMTLYAILLESQSYREGFAASPDPYVRDALRVIHQEISKIFPRQVLVDEWEFIDWNMIYYKQFLTKADRSLALLMTNKI